MTQIVLIERGHNTFQFVINVIDPYMPYSKEIISYRSTVKQAKEWCISMFGNQNESWQLIDNARFRFKNDQDALAFKIMWDSINCPTDFFDDD